MSYATIADIARELKTQRPNDDTLAIAELPKLRRALDQVTARIDMKMDNEGLGVHYFEPWIETRNFIIEPRHVNSSTGELQIPWPFLSFTNISINGAAVNASYVQTRMSRTPYYSLWLTNTARNSYTWYTVTCSSACEYGDVLEATMSAVWGYRRRYDTAWKNSGDSVQNVGGITATGTSITVTDADGVDWEQFTPRFSPGQLLRIDSEFLRVDAVNETTNILTVRRGVNGSTAAIHATSAGIDAFVPEDNIRRGTSRQAALLYARRGAFEATQADGMGGQTTYPQDLLAELRGILQEYQYGR
jgi:hypothetical protein